MKNIQDKVTRVLARQALVVKKHSPHLLFVGGLVGVVGSTILACRATLKLGQKLDDIHNDVELTKGKAQEADKDPRRELARVYGKGAFDIVKLYGPSVVVGSLSIAALTGSHITLSRRNTALTVAYSALDQTFRDYRDRVRKEVGDNKELELYRGTRYEEVTDADGKKTKVPVVDKDSPNPYRFLFDEKNPNWMRDADYNRQFVLGNQVYFNHLLHVRGHVFLNEILEKLGFDHTPAGAVTGWLKNPKDGGDGHIDFGLYSAASENFIMGWERNVWLEFNVDGIIYDKI